MQQPRCKSGPGATLTQGHRHPPTTFECTLGVENMALSRRPVVDSEASVLVPCPAFHTPRVRAEGVPEPLRPFVHISGDDDVDFTPFHTEAAFSIVTER